MYKVTCWNGAKLVSILILDLREFDILLEYMGYIADEEHFIKIKYINPNSLMEED